MSLRYVAIDSNPDALWTFDDASPFTDYSGNSRTASSTATAKHAALVKGTDYSLIVGNTSRISLNAYAVMQSGREEDSFSVGAVFRSIKKDLSDNSAQQVWGNDNQYDGLCIAGTVVSFTTKYTSTGEARCEFDVQDNRSVRAFAVHTYAKNSLYIDGDLVAEVDITPEQRNDTYLADGNTITCGASTGPNLLAVGCISVYRHVVPEDDIESQFRESIDNVSEFRVAGGYGGSILPLTIEHASPYEQRAFSTDEDWNSGQKSGVVVEYEQLSPELRDGISIPGNWTTSWALPQGLGTLYGVTLTWQGQGESVDTSLDGVNWTPVVKGVKTPTIPSGFDPTDELLQIRVTFNGGVIDDPSYVDNLVINTYLSNVAPPVDGRTVTLTNASLESNEHVMSYDANWGAELVNGSLTISAPGTGSFDPQTIEIWAKKLDSSSFTDNVSGVTASYTNGTTLQAYQVDEWQLRTYVISGGFSGAISFSGTGQIGTVVLYPYAKTASEVLETYRSYVGRPVVSVPTQGIIAMTELTDQIDAYEYEWSVEIGG